MALDYFESLPPPIQQATIHAVEQTQQIVKLRAELGEDAKSIAAATLRLHTAQNLQAYVTFLQHREIHQELRELKDLKGRQGSHASAAKASDTAGGRQPRGRKRKRKAPRPRPENFEELDDREKKRIRRHEERQKESPEQRAKRNKKRSRRDKNKYISDKAALEAQRFKQQSGDSAVYVDESLLQVAKKSDRQGQMRNKQTIEYIRSQTLAAEASRVHSASCTATLSIRTAKSRDADKAKIKGGAQAIQKASLVDSSDNHNLPPTSSNDVEKSHEQDEHAELLAHDNSESSSEDEEDGWSQ